MAILSLNETTTFRWSFEDDVAHYAAAGIEAIGVWRQKLSDCGQDRAVELIRQHHLKVSHLFWAGGFTGSEGHSYRESVEDTADALRTAAALGGRVPGGVQRREGRPHLQPRPATRPGRAQGTGAAGRGVRRGDGPGADAPGLCGPMHVPQQSRRRPGHYPGHRPSARETAAGHLPLGPGSGPGGADSRRSPRRSPWCSLATRNALRRASRTAAGWAMGSCRCGRSFARCAGRDTTASSTWNCWAKTSRPWIITACWPTPRKHLPS